MESAIDKNKLYLNRELGLIEFYNRVMDKARDNNVPLLERLNYLGIVYKNCDELFEVYISKLIKLQKANPAFILPDGLTVSNALKLIRSAVTDLYANMHNVYHNELIPALAFNKIHILSASELNNEQKNWIYDYFLNEIKPVLTPISIDSRHPLPKIPNKNLHFVVSLSGSDKFGRDANLAIIEVPRALKRIVKLPLEVSINGEDTYILLQDIIKLNISDFFYGITINGCFPFRVTRTADFSITNSENLRDAVINKIDNRKYAECSRLELGLTNDILNDKIIEYLLNQLNITRDELYFVNIPVNLARLLELIQLVKRPDLMFPKFIPGMPAELKRGIDLFKAMNKGDILIHTPYQSFDPVFELTKKAVTDPNVVAIKMTLYRTGEDSEIVQNLIKAAKLGKQVIVSVELFARFDEEINLELSEQLEAAGANVVYGVMGYKVHAKMLLLVRRENNKLRYYTHLGTGNYHQVTAKLYTDFNLLTTNQEISRDVDNIFTQIAGVGVAENLNYLYQAPFALYPMLVESIEREIYNVKNGGIGEIKAKMNSLIEPKIINALYRASQAGVKIQLIIRGACSLRPGISGLSENIQVKSIVGCFLEHHRVFYFYNNGSHDLYISSADWMDRNLFRRIETCIPIFDKKIKRRIIIEGLNSYIKDNSNSWVMLGDGSYKKTVSRGQKFSAQDYLMKKLGLKYA